MPEPKKKATRKKATRKKAATKKAATKKKARKKAGPKKAKPAGYVPAPVPEAPVDPADVRAASPRTSSGLPKPGTHEWRELESKIIALAGPGRLTPEQIATVLNVTDPETYRVSGRTIESVFASVITAARPLSLAMVAANLFDIAYRGSDSAAVSAGKFFLKTQAGWAETLAVKVSGSVSHDHEHRALPSLSAVATNDLRSLERVSEALSGQLLPPRDLDDADEEDEQVPA